MHKKKHFDNSKTSNGYELVYMPEHPATNKDGYIKGHRLVMEKHLKRYLSGTEVIHHINRNRLDNRLKNLQLLKSSKEHIRIHNGWVVKNNIWYKFCSGCKKLLEVNAENFYFRLLKNGELSSISFCKKCNDKIGKEWKNKNRDRVNYLKRRSYYKMRNKKCGKTGGIAEIEYRPDVIESLFGHLNKPKQ